MKATKLILSIIFVLGISLVLDAKPALDPALLEGLDMKGVDSSMTPVGLIPYTQETSERWNRTIAERHGQNSPQLIFHIPRWVSLSEKYWQNHSPAVHAKAVLYPALVKVFSNPSSYLISGWDSSMIHDILMVTPDAVTSAPFKIPAVLKRKVNKDAFGYDFFLPEGVGELELIKMMQYLQRKAQGEEVGDFSLYKGLVGIPEQVTREASENLDGTDDEDSNCPPIMTHDQSAVVREEEKVSEEKLAELWEKALTEMPNVTTEEELQNPQKRDILKKWQERQKQQEVWNKLIEIGSDKVVEKLKSIIFSSASPRTRAMAFRALFKILDEKNDREGLMSLLEQGILDSTLAKSAYGYLGNLYASYESSPSQRDRIETIISGQLWSQTTPDAISFLLSHHSSVTTLNQLRAIPALDNYLATISLRTDQPDLSGINDDVFSYPDNSPDNLMRYLLMGIQKRLRIGGGGYVNSAPKNTNEENEESSQLFSPTSDDLQFVNQALPVIVKHLSWIDSQQALEQLLESPFVVETYKVKIKERIRQLIEIKKTKLNQELDQVNSR